MYCVQDEIEMFSKVAKDPATGSIFYEDYISSYFS